MRELRSLVPAEVAAVIAIAVVPFPDRIPVALPLFAVATASRWLRGRTWAEVMSSRYAALGALAGLVALVFAVVVEPRAMADRAIVRGNVQAALVVGTLVAITAVAMELALRGWIVERVLELSPGSPILPVMIGAFAEALITPGDLTTRLGALLFGVGLGWMYVSAGRTATPAILARIVFTCGAVLLEALRLVE